MPTIWRLAAAVAALVPAMAAAQAVPSSAPEGTTPPPGFGPSEAMGAHDFASDPRALDAVARDSARAPAASSGNGGARAATAAELIPGASVFDSRGKPIGTVERLDAAGVTVASAGGRVAVPANAFGKDRHGLMLGLTKAQFDQLVAAAHPAP